MVRKNQSNDGAKEKSNGAENRKINDNNKSPVALTERICKGEARGESDDIESVLIDRNREEENVLLGVKGRGLLADFSSGKGL